MKNLGLNKTEKNYNSVLQRLASQSIQIQIKKKIFEQVMKNGVFSTTLKQIHSYVKSVIKRKRRATWADNRWDLLHYSNPAHYQRVKKNSI